MNQTNGYFNPSLTRLISARHLQHSKEYEGLHAEKAKSGVSNIELAIRTGKDFEYPKSKRVKKEPADDSSSNPGPSTSGETPEIGISFPWQAIRRNGWDLSVSWRRREPGE